MRSEKYSTIKRKACENERKEMKEKDKGDEVK